MEHENPCQQARCNPQQAPLLPCEAAADHLNRECHCINVDDAALRRSLDAVLGDAHVPGGLIEQRPHLFARFGVFAAQRHIEQMAAIIAAVEAVVALPAYQAAVLAYAPPIAQHRPRAAGVMFGYDFHLSGNRARLVEINTNAGGALLNAVLARAQRACCDEMAEMMDGPVPLDRLDEAMFAMFSGEWSKAGRTTPLATVAIVDSAPREQYLYPEFLLFQHLFESRGLQAFILDPAELSLREGALWHGATRIDLVYNRLTDFELAEDAHRALREAYLQDAVVLTPHPRAHALYADKRNLTLLTDAGLLRGWGVPEPVIATLIDGIPRTRLVGAADADALWAERRRLFFKPARGYGSRAVYRGDKLTKRVWGEIVAGDYVAQELVLPSERRLPLEADTVDLKLDLRCYAYDGRTVLMAARMYQGQATNFRSPGGGFAPVYTVPCPAGFERPREEREAESL